MPTDRDRLHAWQDFTQHPCWLEWQAELEIDEQTADTALHTGNPRDPVSMAIVQTQHNAVVNMKEYPARMIEELQSALRKAEEKEKKANGR